MILRLQNKILSTVNKVVAVNVHLLDKDRYCYQALTLEKKKGKVIITDRRSNIGTDQKLQSILPANCPLLINIEGWGVLIKEVDFDNDGNFNKQVLPNMTDFEIYSYNQKNKGYIAIIRTKLLQNIITRLESLKANIIEITVGPYDVVYLKDKININHQVQTGGYCLTLKDDLLAAIKPITNAVCENFEYNNDIVSSLHLLPLAQGSRFFNGSYANDLINLVLLKEFSYKLLTIYSKWFVLGLLFISLFVNFFMFDIFNKQYDQISGAYSVNENVLKQLEQTKQKLQQNQVLVKKSGLAGQKMFAWYADKMVELMPQELQLTKLSVYPQTKKIQKNKEINFENNVIAVEGETSDVLAVHRWIKHLKNEKWVQDVELVYYMQNERNKMATFNLELRM